MPMKFWIRRFPEWHLKIFPNKLQEVFKQLRGKGKLTEADVKAAMREVKIALLEADVNF